MWLLNGDVGGVGGEWGAMSADTRWLAFELFPAAATIAMVFWPVL
jgi:hypothetical protein